MMEASYNTPEWFSNVKCYGEPVGWSCSAVPGLYYKFFVSRTKDIV